MIIETLTLITAAIYTGAAMYINFVEQQARLQLDDRALLAVWTPSVRMGGAMQGGLSLLGCILGYISWMRTGNGLWLAGSLALATVWVYSLLIILPVKKALMNPMPAPTAANTRQLIERWGRLHILRTVLGGVAVMMYGRAIGGW